MKRVVDLLIDKKKSISMMESCTGGALANSISNIEGCSDVFKFSAVTYSNFYKVKMGVCGDIIDKYTVYSIEVAREMSKSISGFSDSSYGVGITGKLNHVDKNNLYGEDNQVFVSIYDRESDKFYDYSLSVTKNERSLAKEEVVHSVIEKLLEII